MSKHRPPGYQMPRLVVRPWMYATAALLWAGVTAAAIAREVPVIGIGFCIGFIAVLSWAGGQLTGEEDR